MPREPSEPAVRQPIDLATRRAERARRSDDDGSGVGSTEALVARAQRGDLEAWSRLYHDHFAAVYRHVCFLTGDSALSEDLVQDAFARAMTHAATYDGRASFVNWLRGIALNVVRMHWRRSKTKERVQGDLEHMQRLAPTTGLPDQVHAQERRMAAVYEVLGTLPIHLREAFVLRELEGLSTADAAAQLGISANNLAVRASRARQRIREGLQERGWLGSEGAS